MKEGAINTKEMASIRAVRKENLKVHMSVDGKKWIRILMRKSRSPKVSRKDDEKGTDLVKVGISATRYL